MHATLRNEADVQRYFVPQLLRSIGYGSDAVASEVPMRQLWRYHGRTRLLLARPDFVVSDRGRPVIVVDAKSPRGLMQPADVEQVLSYARHRSVGAPYCILTNGRETRVYDARNERPILVVAQDHLVEALPVLAVHLGPGTQRTPVGTLTDVKVLAKGAFGDVFRGWNAGTRRYEAVKVYHDGLGTDAGFIRRLRQGIKAHARLSHDRIAGLLWFDQVGPRVMVGMSYVDGMPLNRYLQSRRLSTPDKLTLVADVADTLHYAHQQGVAHRDLKPGNIVVAHVDGRPVPHLVDFDTAVVRDATLISVVGEAIGSVGFADPVHGFGRTRQGSLQAALDIYSLGALLYWVFTGKTPPAAGPGAAQRIVETALLGLRGVPAHVRRGLCLLVGHATQPALESRYQTAAALATDLRELAEGALLPGRDSDRLVRDVFTEMDGLLHRRDAGLDIGVRKQGSEVGRWVATKAGGDLYVIYDADYRFFMVGLMFESDQRYREFLASAPYRKLHRLFGTRLRTEAPTQAETGGVYLQHPILEVARRGAAPSGWTMVEEFQQFRRIAGGGPRRAS